MNCEQFQELLQDLARDEHLETATLEGAFAHADSCHACDALLEEAESLSTGLRSLAAFYASQEAPAHVAQELLAAFRQNQIPPKNATNSRWLSAAAIAGALAAAVLGLLLAGHLKRTSPLQMFRPAARATAAARMYQGGSERSTVPGESRAASSPQREPSLVALDDGDGADSFVPLSGAFDPSSLEDGAVVRVVLSGEALESLGLPLGESGDGQVVADLIVTNDGTPQAIRVVSW